MGLGGGDGVAVAGCGVRGAEAGDVGWFVAGGGGGGGGGGLGG